MESERVILSIAALLVLIIAVQKVRRSRYIALQMYFLRKRRQQERMTALLLGRLILQRRRRRLALQRPRRAAWIYPRPQGWFEENYQNPVNKKVRVLKWRNFNTRATQFPELRMLHIKEKTSCHLNKQSLDKRMINHAFSGRFTTVNFTFILPPLLSRQTKCTFTMVK